MGVTDCLRREEGHRVKKKHKYNVCNVCNIVTYVTGCLRREEGHRDIPIAIGHREATQLARDPLLAGLSLDDRLNGCHGGMMRRRMVNGLLSLPLRRNSAA